MHELLLRLFEPVALLCGLTAVVLLLRTASGSRRLRAIIGAACTAAFVLFTTPLGANALLWPLEHAPEPASDQCDPRSAELIVMLTGGSTASPSDEHALERLQEPTFRRAVATRGLAREADRAIVLVSGGGAPDHREAALAAKLLEVLGLAPQRLVVESTSINTATAAVEIRQFASGRGIKKIWLVTSAAHMPRALYALRLSDGPQVCPVATDRQYVPVEFPGALIPQISALNKATLAVHEYAGLAALRVLGR